MFLSNGDTVQVKKAVGPCPVVFNFNFGAAVVFEVEVKAENEAWDPNFRWAAGVGAAHSAPSGLSDE